KVTAFAMELMPRITRAQSMDALSAMSTVAGYKAVLIAANHLPKFFPLLMTAAGTVSPAKVFIIGAGVAGLQAIGTAKRLGAVVVITTALIPGQRAPVLITAEAVQGMRPGSVIVDLAAEQGGNCALTEPGQEVVRHGVVIAGPTNIASMLPLHASQLYARTVT